MTPERESHSPVAAARAMSVQGPRLCENAPERRALRIAFSIALCQQHLAARLVSATTKSRWKFWALVQRLSFHTAGSFATVWRCPSDFRRHPQSRHPNQASACLEGARADMRSPIRSPHRHARLAYAGRRQESGRSNAELVWVRRIARQRNNAIQGGSFR